MDADDVFLRQASRTVLNAACELLTKFENPIHSPLRQRPGMPSPEPLFFFFHFQRFDGSGVMATIRR
jgi:hypothetical protein